MGCLIKMVKKKRSRDFFRFERIEKKEIKKEKINTERVNFK